MFSRIRQRCGPLVKVAVVLLVAFGAGWHSMALEPEAGQALAQALVIVDGDAGRGSGFLLEMDGKTYVVTNSHVIRGNHEVTYRGFEDETLANGSLEIADRVDAVRAEVSKPAGAAHALQMETPMDKVSIGDEIIVAGSSKNEGVEEFPGKVVGIGPDRIEVDADFLPANSGSPILLKSTGRVIGVAASVRPARLASSKIKSPLSLNEVRRFGYRLDTVAKWVKPESKDQLIQEGVKLAELDSLISTMVRLLESNAGYVAKWGVSGFVSRSQSQQYPAFGALASAIEAFATAHGAAKTNEEKAANASDLFKKLEGVLAEDVRGLDEKQFTGYYASQLEQAMKRRRVFAEWCDGTMMPAYLEVWLSAQGGPRMAGAERSSKPAIDPSKVHLELTDHIAPNEPADYCHHVRYTSDSMPPNLDNIYWVVEEPKGGRKSFVMHKAGLRVKTVAAGTYRVYVEYRGGEKPVVLSNVAEVKIAEQEDDGEAVKPAGK